MDVLRGGAVFAAAVGSGLMAGLFATFSVVVMPALRRRPAAEGMAAMQAINVVIVNPLFLVVFLGTALASVVVVIGAIIDPARPGAIAAAAGGVLYLVGSIVVTAVANVPRNNALAAADPAASDGAELWSRYLREWTGWNHVRTVATTAALVLPVVALQA